MALHFSCTVKIENKDEIIGVIAKLGDEFEFTGYQQDEKFFYLEICDGANLEVHFSEGNVEFYCQATPAGPGAHARGIDFVDRFMHITGSYADYTDDTGYAAHRDFNSLQTSYNEWLISVINYADKMLKEENVSELAVGWSPDWYHPDPVPGSVLTCMGQFKIGELAARIAKKGIEDFAPDFFIWNGRERDAWFFRNLALLHLWKDCFFKPSSRSGQDEQINGYVLGLLEEAAKSDIPFPKITYNELCALSRHEPIPEERLAALPSYALDGSLGYRKGVITHFFGNQGLLLPGHFLEGKGDAGKAAMFYDAIPENWHGLTIWPQKVDGLVQNFDMDFFANSAQAPEEFTIENARCCMAFMGPQSEGENLYYTVKAEIISAGQVSFFSVSFKHEAEKEWAFSVIRGIKIQNMDIAECQQVECMDK